MRLLGTLSIVFVVLSVPLDAQAQSIKEALQEFHLFGTWSPNCDESPEQANAWIAYVGSADGNVTRQQIVDERGTSHIYRILSARRAAAQQLALTYELGHNTAYLLIEFRDDRHRTLEARFGETTNIEEGIMKSTGRETAWLSRCR